MLQADMKVIMADGSAKAISQVERNSFVKCEDGSISRVVSIKQDKQQIFKISQKTKHRADTGEPGRVDPKRKNIYELMSFDCTAGHELVLRTSSKPNLEQSYKNKRYRIRWTSLEDAITPDGRAIQIPKHHHKYFQMTPEGKLDALMFLNEKIQNDAKPIDFRLQVRDLDLLTAQIRVSTFSKFSPILGGNGVLSKFLTGKRHLITSSVINMAWLLGLWMGDGTTKEPEITVDTVDKELIKALIKKGEQWGIYPEYVPEPEEKRARHLRLYYGNKVEEPKKTRNLRKHNPFWVVVTALNFKREGDGQKQIPQFMWDEDIEVREAFLAGLIDSDGYVKKQFESKGIYKAAIQTIYPSIMEGISNISRSLGISVTITTRSERKEKIGGKNCHCKFTFDCNITGGTALQNVLAYCRSGHKRRVSPDKIIREPIYFGFSDEQVGEDSAYGIEIESKKSILLENKFVVSSCGSHCEHDQPKLTNRKNLKHCIACPRKGVRYFYKDWSGNNRVCGRCYGRYKFSGYRCFNCQYVPEAREIRTAKVVGERTGVTPQGEFVTGLECNRCSGILKYDEIRVIPRQATAVRTIN
ncbi:hypothetical protein TBLA_0B00330 [Henningerozyma blattae CBS 6284]|uniref:DOD-type homing endonuclease domain-containing protein n=1 Tax=Henningerozyma blattae (strain ATCC 34711 / CBS 6284 / DSM 70876 / NBRC 10599 / NRRL Y-10934 / UCD 77-7) TaxID=1071380 RepID=I2GXM6_HENB6|nr:hypothetical protein TBLA_0B00330 [Tetrapisispora blattae CBS 6284]CCH58878.1 hypothetical protein TBLA_0B00330 [Tetrapisispora blattae CBS 6284]